MYLKKMELVNFRKFSNKDNVVSFVHGHDIYKESDSADLNLEKADKYNFAENITLIVGKNNSGKTTVIRALEKISKGEKVHSSDINFKYLDRIFHELNRLKSNDELKDINILNGLKVFPEVSCILTIDFDHNDKDLLSNIYPMLKLIDFNKAHNEVSVEIKWVIKEQQVFLDKFTTKKYDTFEKFCELLNETNFETKYYRSGEEIKDFKMENNFNVQVINANKINNTQNSLSNAFNKILHYRYKYILENDIDKETAKDLEKNENEFVKVLERQIGNFNNDLTTNLDGNINTSLNTALGTVVSNDIFKIILSSALDIDKLLKNIIKYSYSEGDFKTEEDKFGLGYSNLVMIIAEIIDYLSKYQKPEHPESTINLIVIEEPEVHMHPQMQENFILNVENMVNSLLLNFDKKISTQIIITSHSPHIINSKIHSGRSFNTINYINSTHDSTRAVMLNDELILSEYKEESKKEIEGIEKIRVTKVLEETEETEETTEKEYIISPQKQLIFLKRHMKFQISEIFFSDAVIFIEGATEYTLLPYYLEKDKNLNKKYITLAMVDGAHAQVYFPLLKMLKIPSLIITDLDIKREPHEKNEKPKEDNLGSSYMQIDSSNIGVRETTNNVLKNISGKIIKEIIGEKVLTKDDNIAVVTQNDYINNILPTSFEEAYVLENLYDEVLIEALKLTKSRLSKEWIEKNDDEKDFIKKEKSYEIQMKLDGSKVEFPSNILVESISESGFNLPKLPTYIENGFSWLNEKLGGGQ